MLGFTKDTSSPPKFEKGDIAFTKKDCEKVIIHRLLPLEERDQRNLDMGHEYVVRGSGNLKFKIYEFELQDLDEATSAMAK